jgi:hypothetical protein
MRVLIIGHSFGASRTGGTIWCRRRVEIAPCTSSSSDSRETAQLYLESEDTAGTEEEQEEQDEEQDDEEQDDEEQEEEGHLKTERVKVKAKGLGDRDVPRRPYGE